MSTQTPQQISRAQAVGKLAGLLLSQALSEGDRAALRRLNPESPFTPVLWKVLAYLQEEGAPVKVGDEADERCWATLLVGMAHCIAPGRNLHDYRTPLGRALSTIGWQPPRLEQLLRARGPALAALIRRMAQQLAAREQPVNWSEVADLLFEQEGPKAESVRLRIARSYYTHQYLAENEQLKTA